MGKKLSPYQRIVRNAAKGKGVVLSAAEVFEMSLDDSISIVAAMDDDNIEYGGSLGNTKNQPADR